MNEKQRRFAEHYAVQPNATKAAEAAGYSAKTAYSQGQRLLKNAEIAAHIRRLQEQSASDRILSINRAKALLSDVALSDNIAVNARLKAIDLLLKSAGAMLSPAAPEEKQAQAAEPEPEEKADEYDVIMLPWSGDANEQINAVQLADGRVVPLAGHEDDDLLIFARFEGTEGKYDAEPDNETE